MAEPTEASELELLDRVLFRLGMAESDEQLQKAIGTFMAPALLKLASPHESVKKKVMEILTHIGKRSRDNPRIQLPLDMLFEQYDSVSVPAFTKNFTLVYLEMAYMRADAKSRAKLVPPLVRSLSARPKPHQDILLQMVGAALGAIEIPHDPNERRRVFYGENDGAAASARIFVDYLSDLLVYESPSGAADKHSAAPSGAQTPSLQSAPAPANPQPQTPGAIPPGLSDAAVKRIVGKRAGGIPSADLVPMKLGALKLLSEGLFADDDALVPLLIGAGDAHHAVVAAAESGLQRVHPDMDNGDLIRRMYGVLQGDAAQGRSPVGVRHRPRIVAQLMKSEAAASVFPACIQVAFDCMHGATTNARLRLVGVQMVAWMCEKTKDAFLGAIGPVLLSGVVKMLDWIEEQRAAQAVASQAARDARPTEEIAAFAMPLGAAPAAKKEALNALAGADLAKLKGACFSSIGKLARRTPQLFRTDVGTLRRLFDALATEDSAVRPSVQEALSMLTVAFREAPREVLAALEQLLKEAIDRPEHQVRFAAVQYAAAVFPQDDVASRYTCVLATADAREEVRDEARRALCIGRGSGDPFEDDEDLPPATKRGVRWANFESAVDYFYERAAERRSDPKLAYTVGAVAAAFDPRVYRVALNYLRRCALSSAGSLAEDAVAVEKTRAARLQAYYESLSHGAASAERIGRYRQLIEEALGPAADADLHAVACAALHEVASALPQQFAAAYAERLPWLRSFVLGPRAEMREAMAKVLGVVASGMDSASRDSLLTSFSSTAPAPGDKEKEEVKHGSLVALGQLCAASLGSAPPGAAVVTACQLIARCISHPNALIAGAACDSLGEIGGRHALPFDDGAVDDDYEKLSVVATDWAKADASSGLAHTKRSVVDGLIQLVKTHRLNPTGGSSKLIERAVAALGLLCRGGAPFAHGQRVSSFLLSMGSSKETELQFVVGDALAVAAASAPALMTAVLNDVLVRQIAQGSQSMRRASSVWLMCIVRNTPAPSTDVEMAHADAAPSAGGVHAAGGESGAAVLQARLWDVQSAFISLLSDNDEISQEVASKGLGFVYERGDEAMRKELVVSLADSLLTGKRQGPRGHITDDARLFDEGVLGKTPEGGGMSTYKELCSLANDLNQPDLIYRFMSLASHNAMWSSRRAAAFGFSSIAASAGSELSAHVGALVPKLYRYSFDPNPRVRETMTSIFRTLVPEQRKAVDAHLSAILDDLAVSIGNNQWRVRESSVMALADLLSGRAYGDFNGRLAELWGLALRSMDDVKESVRAAGEAAFKAFHRLALRLCDASLSGPETARKATDEVVPFLLSHVAHEAKEVRNSIILALPKVAKAAGPAMRPHAAQASAVLLESLSALEPQVLNYLAMRAHVGGQDEGKLVGEALDSARVAAGGSSPLMEAIELCVAAMDAEGVASAVNTACETARRGIGVPTRSGCARFVSLLATRHPAEVRPHVRKLLKALVGAPLRDKSAPLRRVFAGAIAACLGSCDTDATDWLLGQLVDLYHRGAGTASGGGDDSGFSDDDVALAARHGSGVTAAECAKRYPDVVRACAARILPQAFMAKFDPEESVATAWGECWEELTPGTEGGARLYRAEIVPLLCAALESASWTVKKQSAEAMTSLADTLGAGIGDSAPALLNVLVPGLSGRTWEGKESLVKAVGAVCVAGAKAQTVTPDEVISKVIPVLVREGGKKDRQYKRAALGAIGNVLEGHSKVDAFAAVEGVLRAAAMEGGDGREAAKDEEDPKAAPLVLVLRATAFESLGKAWPEGAEETQRKHIGALVALFCEPLSAGAVWNVKLAILEALVRMVDKSLPAVIAAPEVVDGIVAAVTRSFEDMKYASLRTTALKVISSLVRKLEAPNRALPSALASLRPRIATLRNDPEPAVKELAVALFAKMQA